MRSRLTAASAIAMQNLPTPDLRWAGPLPGRRALPIWRGKRSPSRARRATGRRTIETPPLVVTIPRELGKEEAVRRLRSGFEKLHSGFAQLAVVEDNWTADHLDFSARLVGQTTSGNVDVGDTSVRLEMQLPWMLAMLAEKAKAIV